MQDDDDSMSTTTSRFGNVNIFASEEAYRTINEKKKRLNDLKQERDLILKLYDERSSSVFEKHRIKSAIDCSRFQVDNIRKEMENKLQGLNRDKEKLKEIDRRIAQRNDMIKSYKEKMEKIKQLLKRSDLFYQNKLKEYKSSSVEIINLEKIKLKQLDKFIFTLIEIKPKLNEDENLFKSTFTALRDARMTLYINGRWILANDQVHYTIVKSKLHSNGDYTAFCKSSLEEDSRDEKKVPKDQQQLSWPVQNRNPDHNEIQSALTYTTQFVNLIAFYLNAVLPYNLPHNKFCSQSLQENEKAFSNAVAKLNVNIIYLCLCQHIPVTNLLPKHTLENLYYFLDYFIKMEARAREKYSITYPNEMTVLFDEMFVKCETDDIGDLDFIPNIPLNDYEEWETLPNSDEIPMDVALPIDQSNNTRSGLFASSTLLSSLSSVTSFFSKRYSGTS